MLRVFSDYRSRFSGRLIFALFALTIIGLGVFGVSIFTADAAFNQQINYQGKLTNSANVNVADGSYTFVFNLYQVSTGGAAIWTETQTVTVTNGLFSVMLGSVSSLASIDFNQTLYLGITVGADSEMTPRKILGAVPNAFNAEKFSGLASTSFLRSDTTNATATISQINFTSATGTNLYLAGAITGATWQGVNISPTYGGTGLSSFTRGDLIFATTTSELSKLAIGADGQVLKVGPSGVPYWGVDITSSGATGMWSTSTTNLALYPSDLNQVLLLGTAATSTTGNIMEIDGNVLLRDNQTVKGYLVLGTTTPTIDLNAGDAWLGGSLYFTASTSVSDSGSDLIFQDANVGSKTLSELVAGAAGCTVSNALLSGGVVTYSGTNFTFDVSPSTYCIGGLQYSSPATQVSLAAADTAGDRIDVIALSTAGTAVAVQGATSTNPIAPSSNPASQLDLTFVYIKANATKPGTDGAGPIEELIYLNNTEWSPTLTAKLDFDSTVDPYQGAKNVEVTTALVNADYFQFATTAPSWDPANYQSLTFYIKNKSAWASSNDRLNISFHSPANVRVGSVVALRHNVFGFDKNNTTSYQKIAIPLTYFGTLGSQVKYLRFTFSQGTSGNTINFRLDNISVQGTAGTSSDPYAVSGYGSDGQIAFFSGNGSRIGGNSALSWNNAARQFTLGTSSASASLVVVGTSTLATTTITGAFTITSTATSTFAGGLNLSSGCYAFGGVCLSTTTLMAGTSFGQTNYWDTDTSSWKATSSLAIDSAGNIGIGASPSAGVKLLVNGMTIGGSFYAGTGDANWLGGLSNTQLYFSSSTNNILSLYNQTGNQGLEVKENNVITMSLKNSLLYSKNGTLWLASTTGSSQIDGSLTVGKSFYITDAGFTANSTNVVMPTTTIGLLQVASHATTTNIYPLSNLQYSLGSSTYRWNEVWAGVLNLGTSTWSLHASSSDGRLSFTNSDSGAGTETFSLLRTGSLGLGTTTPNALLTVNDTGSTRDLLRVATTSAQNVFVINSNGHVGIGEAPAGANTYLRVKGDVSIEGAVSASDAYITNLATNGGLTFAGASGKLTQDANLFWDDTNNRLGVGVGSPSATLHLSANTATQASLIINSGTVLTTPVSGAIENDGTNLFYTDSTVKRQILNISNVIKEPTGFADLTSSTLSFNNTNRVFTLTPVGTLVTYYHGQKWSTTTAITTTIPDAAGLYYIYFDSTGQIQNSLSVWDLSIHVPIAVVYWNGNIGADPNVGILGDERHGVTMDWMTHEYLHNTVGTRYSSGFTGTFSTPTAINMTAGVVYDEDLRLSIPAQTSTRVLYRVSGAYSYTAVQNAYYHAVANILQYDNAGNLGNASNNNYVAYWIFATNSTSSPIVSIMGQRQDASLANARANNTLDGLSLGNLPFKEFKILYRVLLQRSGSSINYIEAQDLRSVSSLPATGNFTPTLHSSLGGLLLDDHTQYLLLAGRGGQEILDNISIGTTTNEKLFSVVGSTTISGSTTVGSLSIGSLSGIVKAVTGYITTALVNLTSDVTGILPVLNGGTGTSTMVAGGVNFSDGTKITQDSTNFYWDNTNKRLGIGTTDPSLNGGAVSKLTIITSADSSGIAIATSTTGKSFAVNASVAASGGWTMYDGGLNGTSWTAGLSQRSGYVGIGKTVPSTALDVVGTASSTGLVVNGNGSLTGTLTVSAPTGNSSLYLTTPTEGADSVLTFTQSQAHTEYGNGTIYFNNTHNTTYKTLAVITPLTVGATTNKGARLEFRTKKNGVSANATTKMTLTDTGKLGVGSVAPYGALSVYNKLADGAPTPADGLIFGNNTNDATGFTQAGIWAVGTSGYNGDLLFGTDGDGAQNNNVTEKMRIKASGIVGIGTASPIAKLNVVGDSAASPISTIKATQSFDVSASKDYFRANETILNINQPFTYGAGAEPQVLSAFASMGGSGSVNKVVSIYGGVQAGAGAITTGVAVEANTYVGAGTLTTGIGFNVGSMAGTNRYGLYMNDIGTVANTANQYAIYTNKGRVYFGDVVGIGKTAPATALDIVGTASSTGLWVNGNATTTGMLTVGNSAGGNSVLDLFEANVKKWSIFNNASDDRLYVTDAGGDSGVYMAQDATSWTANSDIRLKENLVPIDNALSKVLNLTGYVYNFKGNSKREIGLVAQEVLPNFPELVNTDGPYLGLTYDRIAPILVQAIKEQQGQIDLLKTQLLFGSSVGLDSSFSGIAKIPAGALSVKVDFDKPYGKTPAVVANQSEGSENVFVNYKIIRKSNLGFTIILQNPASEDLTFDWIALPIATSSSTPSSSTVGGMSEGTSGCTNPTASNYNPQAIVDDGTCILGQVSSGGGSTTTDTVIDTSSSGSSTPETKGTTSPDPIPPPVEILPTESSVNAVVAPDSSPASVEPALPAEPSPAP